MLKKLLIIGIWFFCLQQVLYGQNLTVSGSNSHSVMVCGNGYLFAWGQNNLGQLGVHPDTEQPYSQTSSDIPLRVGGTAEIFQVDAGSGAHTLAMTCDGRVYAWGNNENGQIGNTTVPSGPSVGVATPTLVMAGATAQYYTGQTPPLGQTYPENANDTLRDIIFVSGGNNTSFAIWKNPFNDIQYALAWGENSGASNNIAFDGLTGDNTTADAARPVFVLNGLNNNQPLEDVIMVEAGDCAGFALTADGRVWSWGGRNNEALGRPETENNRVAYPVRMNTEGGPHLTNIVQISAGDQHCLAIDANGNVWSWGGGWQGQIQSTGGNLNYAIRINAGPEFSQLNPGATYLGDGDPIVSIAAGQAYSIFGTESGRAYAIGMNGFHNTTAQDVSYGTLANGCTIFNTKTTGPLLMRTNATTPIRDVIGVSDGDGWSFVITTNGVYVAGFNANGELGLNNRTNACYLRPLVINGCDLVTPCPEVSLAPDFLECEVFERELRVGLLYPSFRAILYHDDVFVEDIAIPRGGTPTNISFTLSQFGTYRVEIHDERLPTERPCEACPIAWDEITVSPYQPTMHEPVPKLTFCGNNWADLYVERVDNTEDNTFGWYADKTGGTRLALSENEGFATPPIDSTALAPFENDSVYTIWVEDESSFNGYAGRRTHCPNPSPEENKEGSTMFTAYNDFLLRSVDVVVPANSNSYNQNISYTVRLVENEVIQEWDQSANASVPTDVPSTNVIYEWDTIFQFIGRSPNTVITLNINFPIIGNGTSYWLRVDASNDKPLFLNCQFPVAPNNFDDTGLSLIELNKTRINGNSGQSSNANGHFLNWRVMGGSQYPCGRVPVTVTRRCPPCNQPDALTLTGTLNGNTITPSNDIRIDLCPGESITLTTNAQTDASQFEFVWYEGSIDVANELPSEQAAFSSREVTFDANEASVTYYVVVRDKDKPNSSDCWEKATVTINNRPAPTYTIESDQEVCFGESLDPVVVTLVTGTAPWSITYTDGITPNPANNIVGTTHSITPATTVQNSTYSLVTISDAYCDGVVSPSISANVIVKEIPTIEITTTGDALEYCGTAGVTLEAELENTTLSGVTYSWSPQTSTSSTLTGATTGTHTITATLDDCTDTDEVVVIGYDNPTLVTPEDVNYCFGETFDALEFQLTGEASYDIEYTLDATPLTTSSTTDALSITPSVAGTYCITKVTDDNGCFTDFSNECVVVSETDEIVVETQSISLCTDSDGVDLVALSLLTYLPSGGTGEFIGVTGPGSPVITTEGVFTHGGQDGEYTVTYEYTHTASGCKAQFTETIVVNSTLSPSITPENLSVCVGFNLELGTSDYETYEWSGPATTYIPTNALAVQNPIFNSSVAGSYEITLAVTDNVGCAGELTRTIVVHPIPTAQFDAFTPVCEDASDPTISVTVDPSGGTGVFGSSTAIINSTTGEIDVAASGVRSAGHTITYNYTSAEADGACPMLPINTIFTINPKPVLTINYPTYNATTGICIDADPINIALSHDIADAVLTVSPATTALNTTTGVFTPSDAQAGQTYTITYNHTSADGCAGDAVTFEITVNPLPVPDISSNPDLLCDYADPIVLVANIGGTPLTGGTFSGTGVSVGNTFTPANAGAGGPYTITYNYTDPTTGCAALPVTHGITVHNTPALTRVIEARMNTDVTSQAEVPALCPVGTDIEWFTSTNTSVAPVETDPCFTFDYIDDAVTPGRMAADVYTMYATQTINGCRSLPTAMDLVISDCPIPAPEVVTHYSCDGDGVVEVSALVDPTAEHLGWWVSRSDIPPSPTLGDETHIGNTWDAHGYPTAIGTYTVYVANYFAADACYGPASELTIDIKALPNPVIEDPGMICYNQTSVNLSYSPANGELTGNGITGTPGDYSWSIQIDNPDVTAITNTELTLTATTVWGEGTIGEATCSNTDSRTISVTNVIAPTGTGIDAPVIIGYEIVDQLEDMVINTDLTAEATVRLENSTTIIAEHSDLQSGFNLYDEGHIDATPDDNYYYDVTQTLNGCVSPIAVSEWKVVDCPTPEPEIDDITICFNDDNAVFEWTTGQQIEWYDADLNLIGTGASFTPQAIDPTYSQVGEYTFFVSQMQINEYTNILCRGPVGEFKLIVLPLPEFTFTVPTDIVCFDQNSDIQIDIAATGTNTITSTNFLLHPNEANEVALANASATRTYINPDGTEAGITTYGLHTLTLQAEATDNRGCKFTDDATFQIQYTEPPVILEDTRGYAYSNVQDVLDNTTLAQISATVGNGSTNITWYRTTMTAVNQVEASSATHITNIHRRNLTNPPVLYWAVNTENGCRSLPDSSRVQIYVCPIPAPTIDDERICEYDDVPVLSATATAYPQSTANGEMRWYTSSTRTDGEVPVAQGDYQPTLETVSDGLLRPRVYNWYVAEYNSDHQCESPRTPAQIEVQGVSAISIQEPSEVCLNGTMGEFTVNSTFTINWFMSEPDNADPTALTPIATTTSPNVYTPDMPTSAGNLSVWAMSYDGTCYSRFATKTIEVKPIPAAPIVPDLEECSHFIANRTLSAENVLTGETIKWYNDNTLGSFLRNGSMSFATDYTGGTFYVRKEVRGCISDDYATPVVTVVPRPEPLFVANVTACHYEHDEKRVFEFAPDGTNSVRLFQNATLTTELPVSNNTFLAPGENLGSVQEFFIVQETEPTADGLTCRSESSRFTYRRHNIVAVPTIIEQPAECFMFETPSYRQNRVSNTQSGTISWFGNDRETVIGDQWFLDINNQISEPGTYTYYVARQDGTNGCYSDTIPYLREFIERPLRPIINNVNMCREDFVKEPLLMFDEVSNDDMETNIRWYGAKGELLKTGKTFHAAIDSITYGQSMIIYAQAWNGTCASQDPKTVAEYKIHRKPYLYVSDADPICFGEEIQPIFAIGMGSFQWYSSRRLTPLELLELELRPDMILKEDILFTQDPYYMSNEYIPEGIVTMEDTTYSFLVSLLGDETGCASDTIELNMYSAPIPNTKIKGRSKTCINRFKDIYSLEEVDLNNYYVWTLADDRSRKLEGSAGQIVEVDWKFTGVDTLVVVETTPYLCTSTDTMFITVADIPVADFTWDYPGAQMNVVYTNLSEQDSIIDDSVVVPVTYTSYWNYGREQDVFPNVHTYHQRFRIDTIRYKYGTYPVQLKIVNDHGCVDSISYDVFVDITKGLFVPNAFSPSNVASGVRTFLPRGYNLEEYEMTIFDSWGNTLFYTNKLSSDGRPLEGWDGTYNGVPMKTDTYIWKIKATFRDGSKWEGIEGNKKDFGNVVLIR